MIRTTLFVSLLVCGALWGQSAAPVETANKPSQGTQASSNTPAKPAATGTAYRFPQNKLSSQAQRYYGLVWGIDSLSAKYAESGELIRFSFHVLDAEKAKTLNDKKLEPSLIDPQAGVSLVIPTLEKVGQLRQVSTPEAGKSYWMAFSNVGRRVRPGDRVTVVIGNFRAEGLIVN